jgi:uncharacterized protein involved in cysteine biosynthesis
MVIGSFVRAVRALKISGVISLIIVCLLVTAAVLTGLFAASSYLLFSTELVQDSALDTVIDFLGSFAALGLVIMLFPAFLPFIAGLFQEKLSEIIEREDPPEIPVLQHQSVTTNLLYDGRFALLAVALNLLILPFFFFPPLWFLLFYGLNSYLLGREFFEAAASRYVSRKDAASFRRRYRVKVFICGMLIFVAATIPFVNLIAPFLAMAFATYFSRGLLHKERTVSPVSHPVA